MEQLEDIIRTGDTFFEKKNYSAALFYYNTSVRSDIPNPKKAYLWNKISCAYFHLKKFYNSFSSINTALELDPGAAIYWIQKGDILQSEAFSRYNEAINSYNKAAALDPHNPTVWIKLGVFNTRIQKFEEALEAYNKALTLRPNDPELWYKKACVLNLMLYKKEKESRKKLSDDLLPEIELLTEVLRTFHFVQKLDPRNSNVLYIIGVLHTKLKQYDEALHSFDEALKYHASDKEKPMQIWYTKAELLEKMGRSSEAIEFYDRYDEALMTEYSEFMKAHPHTKSGLVL
jgi:tetratricopeptide (TPR) repeat protein